uniref:CSC1/OSCA1-like N-terminal transmembrane domain-containing protein n=1 Tax=Buteo japonicus TaxID=224669 RepID=A0A8C0BBH2_9AVES
MGRGKGTSFLDALVNSTEEQCFSARSRSTVLEGLPFGGVPTVLLLLLVFSCLRKAAWDYGRLALLMDNDSLSKRAGRRAGTAGWPTEKLSRDEEIQSKCGIDATTYLSFQRHLLVLLMLVCVLSVAVILPVNFSGDLLGHNPTHFGRTTIANIPTQYVAPASWGAVGAAAVVGTAGSTQTWRSTHARDRDRST